MILIRGKIVIDGTTYSENTLDQLPQHLSLERAFTRNTPNGIAFHSEHSFLSSFYKTEINYGQHNYTSSEQGIQHTKAKIHKNEDIAHEIMQTNEPIKIKRLGDKIKPNEAWQRNQDKWAEEITFAKFDQNPKLAQALADTKQAPLLECTLSNHWGVGVQISHPDLYKRSFKPRGKNTLGKILERKREDIRRTIASTTPPALPPPPPPTVPPPNAKPAPAPALTNQTVSNTPKNEVTLPPPPIPPRTTLSPPPPAHNGQFNVKEQTEKDHIPLPLDFRIPIIATTANTEQTGHSQNQQGLPQSTKTKSAIAPAK